MSKQFKVISGASEDYQQTYKTILPAERLQHFKNVTGCVLQDALDTWADIWNELQGSVTHGVLVSNKIEMGFTPQCGWPEFLEKMWLLRHYLDYVKRLSDLREDVGYVVSE